MRHKKKHAALLLANALLIGALAIPPVAVAATITIVNLDDASEGFNDPSAPDADSTAGGNTGATLGAQRLIAFQFAANIWGGILSSAVSIKVDARMDPQSCSGGSATLGSAGPNFFIRDFAGATFASTWYAEALANKLNGSDLAPTANDMAMIFNSAIGTTCPFPNVWYYGLDANSPGGKIDFVTVVAHELAHGLGSLTLVDLTSGEKALGFDDIFMRNLEDHSTGKLYSMMTDAERAAANVDTGDLHWVGAQVVADGASLTSGRHGTSGHVQMYAPDPVRPGSSVSHFDTALFPNEQEEPFYTGPDHSPGLGRSLMTDIDWGAAAADLSLTMADALDPVTVGDVVSYTVTVTNNGPNAATGVIVTDTLPGNVTLQSASPVCSEAAGVVTCNVGALANGAAAVLSLVVSTAATPPGTITNNAGVAANEFDSDLANNTASEVTTIDAPPVAVPQVAGLSQSQAKVAILAAGLTLGTVNTANSATVPAGIVISQDPAALTLVALGSAVDLLVSLGPALGAVPDVVGQEQASAEAAITAAGLTLGTVTTADSATVPAGDVISQDPAALTLVALGSAVDLVISLGPARVATPTFSPDGRTFRSVVEVTIATGTPGATLRYTTDGSTPTPTNGTVYVGPVTIAATTTLKAMAHKSGLVDSAVKSAVYVIGALKAMPWLFLLLED